MLLRRIFFDYNLIVRIYLYEKYKKKHMVHARPPGVHAAHGTERAGGEV